ncbi:MAG: hypothetical protein AUJ39_01355 [Parcubacteria group bacterium CG1_02_42_13]|uniref:DUF1648 domain-containing protein n=1 Tax=Candidatus Colwellbacteria bacterium CG23_combo_of_CG06-09_8_20_14_all_42_19 TaxID=1974541 RepID=A0A2H0AN54_9BACT|nr:MAG: hypothetical protein AUJ39_01355 [Parcubacteria group bacterium CG1_02_42_13]PIP46270.1 MAG: hypothetical protein COX15_01195 [Candidatus Colwellbacteria bacterium CG23_combo_of_CG06-09_8_20_14_all_42_19]
MIRNLLIISLFGLSLTLLIVSGVMTYTTLYGVEGPFIIHFNYKGEVDVIGGNGNIFNIITIAGIIVLINFILAYHLYNRERILSYIFSGTSLIIVILTFISVYLISSVN